MLYDTKQTARRLKRARQLAGITRQELAKRIGCSSSVLDRTEAGQQDSIKDTILAGYSVALRVPIDKLMGLDALDYWGDHG